MSKPQQLEWGLGLEGWGGYQTNEDTEHKKHVQTPVRNLQHTHILG